MKFFERLTEFVRCIEITHVSSAEMMSELPVETDELSQAEELYDAMAQLSDSVKKLGRTQFRANTLAESDRKEIKQMLLKILSSATQKQKETLADLLLVVDGLEEGINQIEKLNSENGHPVAWADGFRIVHERLLKILKKLNVTPIEAVGQPFTPHLHRAVDTIETDGVAENTVTEEQRRGYLYGTETLRYAEVVVSKKGKVSNETNYWH